MICHLGSWSKILDFGNGARKDDRFLDTDSRELKDVKMGARIAFAAIVCMLVFVHGNDWR